MTGTFHLVSNNIGSSIRAYAAEMRIGMAQAVRFAARGATRRIINITPPNQGDNASGSIGKKIGESAISRDMSTILAPKKLKGRRQITTVFGRKLAKPIFVPTKEKYPDVRAIYKQNVRFRSAGIGTRKTLVGHKFYVDERKFKTEYARRIAAVGKLASGWDAAAVELDVPVAAWISRHGTFNGLVKVDLSGSSKSLKITVENRADGVPENIRAELARRIPYALQYEGNALLRAVQGHHDRLKQKIHSSQAA